MLKWIFAAILLIGAVQLKADQTTQDTYLQFYVRCHDAEQLEKNGDFLEALAISKVAIFYFQIIKNDPGWETALLLKRIKELQDKVTELQPKATKQFEVQSKSIDNHAPSLSVLSHDAADSEKTHDYWNALVDLQKCSIILGITHTGDPNWESAQMEEKIKQTQADIERVEALAAKELEKGWSHEK